MGVSCTELIETLFADRVLYNLRAAQGIIRLADKYGSQRLEAACRRALFFENPRYGTVKTILKKGLDQDSVQPLFPPLAAVYTGNARFSRPKSAANSRQ